MRSVGATALIEVLDVLSLSCYTADYHRSLKHKGFIEDSEVIPLICVFNTCRRERGPHETCVEAGWVPPFLTKDMLYIRKLIKLRIGVGLCIVHTGSRMRDAKEGTAVYLADR